MYVILGGIDLRLEGAMFRTKQKLKKIQEIRKRVVTSATELRSRLTSFDMHITSGKWGRNFCIFSHMRSNCATRFDHLTLRRPATIVKTFGTADRKPESTRSFLEVL